MNRQKVVVGLSLLCALAFCAFGAASASAKGTTTFLCEAVSEGAQFEDEHCTKAIGGGGKGFKHVEITPNTEHKMVGTNNLTGASTSTAIIKATVGVAIEIQSTTASSEGRMENKLVGGVMQATGWGITMKFSGLSVPKPVGQECKVKGGTITTNNLKTISLEGEGATNTGLKFEPESGEAFATITLEGCKTAGLNKNYTVTGNAVASPNGATVEFTEAGSAGLNLAGQKASLSGISTARTAPEGEKLGTPVSVTTTEP